MCALSFMENSRAAVCIQDNIAQSTYLFMGSTVVFESCEHSGQKCVSYSVYTPLNQIKFTHVPIERF